VPGCGEDATVRFGDVGRPFWEKTDFFNSLGACLLAAIRTEQWPPQSGIFHRPWKLARACKDLSLAGFGADLAPCVAPLVSLVVARRGAGDSLGDTDADAVTASHLAAAALRGLAGSGGGAAAAAAAAEMLEAPGFLAALEHIKGEEDSARQLLEQLQDGGSAFVSSAGQAVASPVQHDVASTSPF